MPGPRRRKPPVHRFPPLELPGHVNEAWLRDWFDHGYAELEQYLACRYRFAEYLDKHHKEETP